MCIFVKLGALGKILIIANSVNDAWGFTFIAGVRKQLSQLGSKHYRSLHCSLLRLLTDETAEEIDKLPVPSPDRNLRVRKVVVVLGSSRLAG